MRIEQARNKLTYKIFLYRFGERCVGGDDGGGLEGPHFFLCIANSQGTCVLAALCVKVRRHIKVYLVIISIISRFSVSSLALIFLLKRKKVLLRLNQKGKLKTSRVLR